MGVRFGNYSVILWFYIIIWYNDIMIIITKAVTVISTLTESFDDKEGFFFSVGGGEIILKKLP